MKNRYLFLMYDSVNDSQQVYSIEAYDLDEAKARLCREFMPLLPPDFLDFEMLVNFLHNNELEFYIIEETDIKKL